MIDHFRDYESSPPPSCVIGQIFLLSAPIQVQLIHEFVPVVQNSVKTSAWSTALKPACLLVVYVSAYDLTVLMFIYIYVSCPLRYKYNMMRVSRSC